MRSWIHRCYYHTSQEAIGDAQRAYACFQKLYVVRQTGGPPDVWEDGIYWIIMEQPPFCGQVGIYYHPEPEHYIVTASQSMHVPGEES